jgi:hypothetical protein
VVAIVAVFIDGLLTTKPLLPPQRAAPNANRQKDDENER